MQACETSGALTMTTSYKGWANVNSEIDKRAKELDICTHLCPVMTLSNLKFFLLCSSQLIWISNFAQFNPERQALNKIKKGQWNTAIKILSKSLLKDSLNAQSTYVYSLLYLNPDYPKYNLNTANYFKNRTIRLYHSSDDRSKERFRRLPLDSIILSNLTRQIDSTAFEQAKRESTETAYIHFLTHYPDAWQTQSAIELRDEAAFVTALKKNTQYSFQDFLVKYPNSHRAKEAKQRFDKLLFDYETRNKTVEAYEQFVKRYPTSPFADQALQFIYETTTLSGSEESFENFIIQYPKSKKYQEALQYLLHIKLAKKKPVTLTDSLRKIYPLREWIPFYENSKWGFMDERGNEVFPASLNGIDPKHLCEPLQTDFINTNAGIIGRNGATILRGKFNSVSDLGLGFIYAEMDSSVLLLHKSGNTIRIPGLQHAILIDSQFLACQKANVWGLFSFTGQQLLPFSYDKITSRGRFVIFSKSGKEILVELRNIIPYAQGKLDPIAADEIKRYGSKYFWIRNGALEKILDDRLNEILPFDRQQILFGPAGLVVTKNKSHYLKDWPALAETSLASYQIFEPWLVSQKPFEKPALHFIPSRELVVPAADSIWFDASFAGVKKGDTVRLMQSPTKHFNIPIEENYTIKKSRDSVIYILTKNRNRTSVYLADSFEKILTTTWASIEPLLENTFLIKEKEKYGLMDEKNRMLLQPEFDGIILSEKNFTLLKNRKFGIYNQNKKQLLKPILDANPVSYNAQWAIGRKENRVGFINLENLARKITFEFDEVTYWTDSIAIVKKDRQTSLYSFHNNKIILSNLGAIHTIMEAANEKMAIFSKTGLTGVMGSLTGIILNPEFHELTFTRINSELIFIGMKKLRDTESEIYYMNSTGKLLRKTITDLETAYSILCEN